MKYIEHQRWLSRCTPTGMFSWQTSCIALLISSLTWGTVGSADGRPQRFDGDVISPSMDLSAMLASAAEPAPDESAAESQHYSFPDGTYLFGQSPEPEQIGAVYAVFDVRDQHLTGAFYMPRSSFDCFRGQVEGDRLAVMVRNSYEQTTFPYSIGLVETQGVVASGGSATLETGLEGFHRLTNLSENDRRILATCQSESW